MSKRLHLSSRTRAQTSSIFFSYTADIYNNSISVVDTTNDRKHLGSRCYNLSSPRDWMEHLEATHSSAGAYTVMRCDISQSKEIKMKAYLWGLEFHLDRLCTSFEALLKTNNLTDVLPSPHYEVAVEESRNIISALVDELETSQSSSVFSISTSNQTITAMITILWSKRGHDIHVQGHLFSNNKLSDPHSYDCVPITTVIAGADPELPSRHDHTPSAKLSSWCRKRRPLEDKFKINGIDEVLLARNISSVAVHNMELLEGLTSNLFIVYKDGTIRSPTKDVLCGFAQYLVMKAAKNLGIQIVDEPITLQDARDGLWAEAFVTSSVRLIIPVGKIMFENSEAPVDWTESDMVDLEWDRRKWRWLYESIINSYDLSDHQSQSDIQRIR
jgi:hypothetical protein